MADNQPQHAELVRHLNCPNCLVWWDFQPPRWLGEPWTREQADRLMRDHSRLVHPELIDGVEQKPGRKSHDATSARAPVSVTFCMDDGCRYAAGHDGPHDITWQDAHRDGVDDE